MKAFLIRALAAGALGTTALLAPGSAHAAPTYSVVNNNTGFINVYVNNVENLETAGESACPGDWQDLIYYMKLQHYSPDVFIVQQIANVDQARTLRDRLTSELSGIYDFVIAKNYPESQSSHCITASGVNEKRTQTNAIFYRTGRFDVAVGPDTWWSLADPDDNGHCQLSDQDRALNVRVKLHDKVANKDVTVQSVHWPTSTSGGGNGCADENIDKTVDMATSGSFGGNLRIVGMDANVTDLSTPGSTSSSFHNWYKKVNGQIVGSTYQYRDAIYSACGGSKSCLINNWTNNSPRRIDYLLANKYTGITGGVMPAVTNGHTVTFNEGDAADNTVTGSDREDLDYSEHRAVWAYVNY
jgi:hypothetical protein